MTGQVIHIKFSTDLPTRAQNALRARMEYKAWKDERDQAMLDDDTDALERLDRSYELIGLP